MTLSPIRGVFSARPCRRGPTVFPLGQLQNQAYGYLFPQGPFFALLSPLPDWITQRLWWALLLTLAFAGTVKLLDALKVGSRGSRLVAAILYALSPRILTTLGAISSEAWPVALVPWILLPVVRILDTGHGTTTGLHSAADRCGGAVLGGGGALSGCGQRGRHPRSGTPGRGLVGRCRGRFPAIVHPPHRLAFLA